VHHQLSGQARDGNGSEDPPLVARKSVLLGILTSGFVVANAAPAVAEGKPQRAASPPVYVAKWAPFTSYAHGQQVISANNDVVSANVAHRSSASYVPDAAKWTGSSTYAAQFTAASSTTADDVTAWLAVPYAGRKRLTGSATIAAPIVIPSNTYLDATGATITLAPGAQCQMLKNAAVAPLRAGSADAVVTGGSTTVTTATGAFTSADVGRTLQVAFTNESVRGSNVYAKIVTVNSATSVVVDNACNFTESGGIARVYGRDINISITGGIWDAGANTGTALQAEVMFLRRIDKLRVANLSPRATGRCQGIGVGDCKGVLVENVDAAVSSDLIHLTGPCSDVVVRNITGTSGDDVIGCTTSDSPGYNDVHGSFRNMHFSDVSAVPPNGYRMLLLATSCSGYVDGHSIDMVTVDRVNDLNGISSGIVTWVQSQDSLSRIDNLIINDVTASIELYHTLHGRVTINGLRGSLACVPMSSGTTTNYFENLTLIDHDGGLTTNSGTPTAIGNLIIRGGKATSLNLACNSITNATVDSVSIPAGSSYLYNIGACTITNLSFLRCNFNGNSGSINTAAVVTNLSFSDCVITASGSGGRMVMVSSGCTVGTLRIARCTVHGYPCAIQNAGTASVNMFLTDTVFDSNDYVAYGTAGFDVRYANVKCTSQTFAPFYADGIMTLAGTGFTTSTAAAFDGSTTLHVKDPMLTGPLSLLTKANGDAAFNTNSGLACGVGPAVSDGTNWKNVYSGAVY
jgi:hypothetical protein